MDAVSGSTRLPPDNHNIRPIHWLRDWGVDQDACAVFHRPSKASRCRFASVAAMVLIILLAPTVLQAEEPPELRGYHIGMSAEDVLKKGPPEGASPGSKFICNDKLPSLPEEGGYGQFFYAGRVCTFATSVQNNSRNYSLSSFDFGGGFAQAVFLFFPDSPEYGQNRNRLGSINFLNIRKVSHVDLQYALEAKYGHSNDRWVEGVRWRFDDNVIMLLKQEDPAAVELRDTEGIGVMMKRSEEIKKFNQDDEAATRARKL
jgi:hypothetical protein